MAPNLINVFADDALSVSTQDVDQAHRIAQTLRNAASWREVVPGLDSVVVTFCPTERSMDQARRLLERQLCEAPNAIDREPKTITLPIRYGGVDGPDFHSVCSATGLTPEEFIRQHTSVPYRVELIGFTPGFAYIGGMGERFDLPRLATPRRFVEAGSVGLAARYTGLYAMPGPGGWPLIGRTQATLFDADSASPFQVHAGDWIRFVSVDES